MKTIILSGVGGSVNWVPFLFPLAALVAIYYAIDQLVKFIKRKKLQRTVHPANDLNDHFEDVTIHP